jgi:hypothetical protein
MILMNIELIYYQVKLLIQKVAESLRGPDGLDGQDGLDADNSNGSNGTDFTNPYHLYVNAGFYAFV